MSKHNMQSKIAIILLGVTLLVSLNLQFDRTFASEGDIPLNEIYNVDIILAVGFTEVDSTNFEQDIKNALASKGIIADRINFNIVETLVTSTKTVDVETIINNWVKYNDTTTWKADTDNNLIYREANTSWSGMYDPTYYSGDYTFELEMMAEAGDNDDIGITFCMSQSGESSDKFGLVYLFGGFETTYENPTPISNNSHRTGLYFKSNINLISLNDRGSDLFNTLDWYKFRVDVKENNAKIYKNDLEIVDYTRVDDIQGGLGFFTNSQEGSFRNVSITSTTKENLSDVINDLGWRDTTQRFFINLEDNLEPNFSDVHASGEILTNFDNEDIHYIGWGTNTNKSEAENFIVDNDNRGTFVNNGDYSSSISSIADYIYNVYFNTVDHEPTEPVITMTEAVDDTEYNGSWTNSNISITIDGSIDNFTESSDIIYEYSTDGVNWNRASSFDQSEEGINTIYAKAVDEDSNKSNVVTTTTKIDKTNPTIPEIELTGISGDSYDTNTWSKEDIIFNLSNSTDNLGNIRYMYSTDGANWIENTSETITCEGITTLYYKTVDEAGNNSDTSNLHIKIDKTSPTIPVIQMTDSNGDEYIINSWTTSSSIIMNLSDSVEDLSGLTYQYKIDDGSWTEGMSKEFTEDGIRTIEYRAIDEAGNISDTSSIQVKIDKTKPLIELIGEENIILNVNDEYIELGVNTSDSESGLSVEGQIDGNVDTLIAGNYVITYTSIDNAGNMSQVTRTVTINPINTEENNANKPVIIIIPKEIDIEEISEILYNKYKLKDIFKDEIVLEKGIKRKQIGGIIIKTLEMKNEDYEFDEMYEDFSQDDELYELMKQAIELNIFKGYGNRILKPNEIITREEMATVVYRAMNTITDLSNTEKESDYKDRDDIQPWAKDKVDILFGLNIIDEYEDGEFKPKKKVTIGEALKILYKMLEFLNL